MFRMTLKAFASALVLAVMATAPAAQGDDHHGGHHGGGHHGGGHHGGGHHGSRSYGHHYGDSQVRYYGGYGSHCAPAPRASFGFSYAVPAPYRATYYNYDPGYCYPPAPVYVPRSGISFYFSN